MKFFKTMIVLLLIAILGISISQVFAAGTITITSKGRATVTINEKDKTITYQCDNSDNTVCSISIEPLE